MIANSVCSMCSFGRVECYLHTLCLGSLPKKKTSPETQQSVLGPTEQELVVFPLQECSAFVPLSKRIIVSSLILIFNLDLKAKQYKF